MLNTTPFLRPTAAELDLLRVLWQIGPADAKSVYEALIPERPMPATRPYCASSS